MADAIAAIDWDEALPPEAEGLVFDLDGTVLNTMPHHWEAWRRTAAEHGFALSAAKLLALAGKPSTAIIELLIDEQSLHGRVDAAAAVARKTQLYLSLAHATEEVAAVMAVARAAKARGLPVAVATGGSRAQVERSLAAAGLADFFDAVVTADDISPGRGKPHPETFLRAAAAIGVPPGRCVGFEDAPLGMEAIRAAGFLRAVDVTTWAGYPHLDGADGAPPGPA